MHEIKRMVLGPINTNTYIIDNEIIIDPAAHAESIAEELEGRTPIAILLTHGHFDHMLAVNKLREIYPYLPVYCHPGDMEILAHPGEELVWRKYTENAVYEFTPLEDGQILRFNNVELRVIHTPGHTEGCVCYYDAEDKVLFSGDTIFFESYGRTDFKTGSMPKIKDSIFNKIFGGFADEDVDVIYPGHGQETTLAHERLHNPILVD